jgi:hypothetical protein
MLSLKEFYTILRIHDRENKRKEMHNFKRLVKVKILERKERIEEVNSLYYHLMIHKYKAIPIYIHELKLVKMELLITK